MLQLLRDAWHAKAADLRYRRTSREQLLQLMENNTRTTSRNDDWYPVGHSGTLERPLAPLDKIELRQLARRYATHNPHAVNVLRLLEAYVIGPECRVLARPVDADNAAHTAHAATADAIWRRFLAANVGHFGYREFARRTWRDGENFLRLFASPDGIARVRFIDPERIGPPAERPELVDGFQTDPNDVETVIAFARLNDAGTLAELIPAEQLLHTKIGADSNEARGVSFLTPLLGPLQHYERWLETELIARKLAASILLWRKVADGSGGSFGDDANDSLDIQRTNRDRFEPGSILTTSADTSLAFLNPQTDLRDSAPLGRMLLLAAAAAAGLPEYMLTGDASNSNYASTLIAEGPAVKLFMAQQRFYEVALSRVWWRVMQYASQTGLIPPEQLALIEPDWTFPQVVARDRPRERYADIRLVQAGVLSRAEAARRDNVDPSQMRSEIMAERQPIRTAKR